MADQFTDDDLVQRFNYHPPQTDARRAQHQSVRDWCLSLAQSLNVLLPDGREKALAVTNLEQVMFWGNAAIARHPDKEFE